MIRLIASDIDGTLIKDSTPDLYPEMADAIRELKKRDILFCAASGRQYESIRNVFRDIKEGIVFIAENGAQIRYQEKDIRLTLMRRSMRKLLSGSSESMKACAILWFPRRMAAWWNRGIRHLWIC